MSAVIICSDLEPKKIKSVTVDIVSLSINIQCYVNFRLTENEQVVATGEED